MSHRPKCADCVFFDPDLAPNLACHVKPGEPGHAVGHWVACGHYRNVQDHLIDTKLKDIWRRKQLRDALSTEEELDNFLPALIMGVKPKGQG